VPWGDSDADRGAISNGGLWAYLAFGDAEPLRIQARLVGTEAVKQQLHGSLWRIPDFDRLAAELKQPASKLPPRVSWQRRLKQVMLRTSWEREALSVFFAARSPVEIEGHAHTDPMGFDFTALGKPLVVDPGRFTYREGADRRAFKSATSHNTITVNHREPFEYLSNATLGPQKEAAILRVIDEPNLLAAEAVQQNYEPAIHRRVVALVDAVALVVLDRFSALSPESSIQIYYHLDSTDVKWDPARQEAAATMGDPGLLIATAGTVQGSLLPGRISERYDVVRDSTRLLLEDASDRSPDRAYAAVLVPYRMAEGAPRLAASLDASGDGLTCTFSINDRRYALIWDDAGVRLA
jgi:hypothetical protein